MENRYLVDTRKPAAGCYGFVVWSLLRSNLGSGMRHSSVPAIATRAVGMASALRHEPLPARLVTWVSNFENPCADHTRTIGMHPFNAQVEVFVPHRGAHFDQGAAHAALSACFADAFYYEVTCPLADLLQPAFLDAHANQSGGTLYGVSIGTPIDHSNVVAFLPNGRLLLVVDKDTIEQLGLQGSMTPFVHDPRRFRIELRTNEASFRPGRKLFDRVQWCLGADRVAPVTLRMACVRSTCALDCITAFVILIAGNAIFLPRVLGVCICLEFGRAHVFDLFFFMH